MRPVPISMGLALLILLAACGAQDPKAKLDRGNQQLVQGSYDAAIASFRAAIELDPDSGLAHAALAEALALNGQRDEAIASYQKAIELDPTLKSELEGNLAALVRARIVENESNAMGAVRTVVSAELSYAAVNGGFFDRLECLAEPGSCLPNYADQARSFLERELASPVYRGYRLTFYAGPAAEAGRSQDTSSSSISSFTFVAVPVEPGVTGTRGFCGDSTGRLCETTDGRAPRISDNKCAVLGTRRECE